MLTLPSLTGSFRLAANLLSFHSTHKQTNRQTLKLNRGNATRTSKQQMPTKKLNSVIFASTFHSYVKAFTAIFPFMRVSLSVKCNIFCTDRNDPSKKWFRISFILANKNTFTRICISKYNKINSCYLWC